MISFLDTTSLLGTVKQALPRRMLSLNICSVQLGTLENVMLVIFGFVRVFVYLHSQSSKQMAGLDFEISCLKLGARRSQTRVDGKLDHSICAQAHGTITCTRPVSRTELRFCVAAPILSCSQVSVM